MDNHQQNKTDLLEERCVKKDAAALIKFLLIENDPEVVREFHGVLNFFKEPILDFKHATTLREAIARAKKELPDVILTNLFLPDARGLEILEKLQKEFPKVPVIVLTAFYEDLGFEAVKKGAQDYLVKEEIDPKFLLRVIRHAIERKSAEQALLATTSELKAIFQAFPDILFRLAKDGAILEYNAGRAGDLYVSPQEFLGKKMQDVLPRPIAKKFDEAIKEVSRTKSLVCMEYPLSVPSGEKIFEARVLPLPDEQIIAVIRDVTENRLIHEELYHREAFLQKQKSALLKLAKHKMHEGDFQSSLQEIMKIAAQTLGVERASVWLYNHDRSQIECIELYEESCGRHSFGAKLAAVDYPYYFRALEEDRAIAAHDAREDSRTKEFAENYLKPLGITSMLDAPIRLEGQIIGVVCHEHIGKHRQWTLEEQNFAGSVADFISLAVEHKERRRVEEALRESESRYRGLIEMAPDTIFTISTEDMTIASLNPAFEKYTGWPRSRWIGQSFIHIVHPEDLPLAIGTFEKILATQKSSPLVELRFLAATGRYRVGEVVASPIVKEGKVTSVFGVVRDITERKKSEEELRILSRAIEQSPSTVVITDTKGNIQYVNPKFTEVTGYSLKEVLGKNPRILKSEKLPPEVYKELWETISFGGIWRGEFCNKKKNGEYYWGQAAILPIRDPNGGITHFIGVEENITERKKAEGVVRQQIAAMTASMDGLAVLNDKEEYIYVNEAHAKIYGYDSPGELLGKTWRVLYGEKELERFEKEIMPQFWKEKKWRGEAVGKKRDGSFFPQEISLTAIEGGGLVCVARDIAERKKSEEELNDYRRHLETLVEERTRELRHSERLAATGRLAASIAHEINNPLQGMMTHLEIIRDGLPEDFNKTKNFESVRSNIEKIRGIVFKLLDTYRGGDEAKAPADINEIVKKVAALIEHQLELKNIRLTLQLAEKIPAIDGWRQQLHQVFLNLILNAHDSIKEKGEVTVKSFVEGAAVCVSVADTGEGMRPEEMDHLFEPFFTTKKESGTGLGLFVSQGIIKEHKGVIKAKTQLGKGSIFTVVLPIKDGQKEK